MLAKVSNIASNDLLQQKNTAYRKKNSFRSLYEKYRESDDEAELSPAVKYLSKLGWSLKNLVYEENQKLEISFSTNGFNFFTVINISYPEAISAVNLNIKMESDDSVTLLFEVPAPNNYVLDPGTLLEFESLKNLFARINYAKEIKGRELNESMLAGLSGDIIDAIDLELKRTAGLLIEFVMKLVPDKFIFHTDNIPTNRVKLKNVKIC